MESWVSAAQSNQRRHSGGRGETCTTLGALDDGLPTFDSMCDLGHWCTEGEVSDTDSRAHV